MSPTHPTNFEGKCWRWNLIVFFSDSSHSSVTIMFVKSGQLFPRLFLLSLSINLFLNFTRNLCPLPFRASGTITTPRPLVVKCSQLIQPFPQLIFYSLRFLLTIALSWVSMSFSSMPPLPLTTTTPLFFKLPHPLHVAQTLRGLEKHHVWVLAKYHNFWRMDWQWIRHWGK